MAPLFGRDEVAAGLPARRATGILFAIEARTARLVDRSRSAMATFETEGTTRDRERAFLEALAGARDLPVQVTVQDLERHATGWAELVPPDAAVRAALIARVSEKYGLVKGRTERLAAGLGADDPAVMASYERITGQSVESSLVADPGLPERLRWQRARLAERLERLPPFWIAFGLALTETVAEGVLAIPVAVAGVGPWWGIALLVVLGIVNVITLVALIEAITRTGRMRYGDSYFGRLVREYLGDGSATLFSVALFVFNAVILLVYFLGFASVLADATGLGLSWWVALIFAVNVYFMRRESLDATVASALVIGAVNVVLILAICAIGLSHLDAENFVPVDLGGLASGTALLQLVFGVILVAYFGHTSAGNAAKLLLREDATGRSLLAGNVAGMVTVIVLYSLCVLAINGAVAADRLVGFEGTAISPLADVAGSEVLVLGSIYVVLALGIGSVYASLGLRNQVREWLPGRSEVGSAATSWRRPLASSRAVLWTLLPATAVFVLLELLILIEVDDFAAPLALVGVLTVPLLGGVFPMLLVAAARYRGEFVPRPIITFVGRPIVVVGVSSLFVIAIAVHGLFIWTGVVERVLALGLAVGLVSLGVVALRRGAFRPRDVVQLRIEGPGAGSAFVEVVEAGRPGSARTQWQSVDGPRTAHAASVLLGSANDITQVICTLAREGQRALRIWVHRVDREGASAGTDGSVTLEDPDQRRLRPDGDGIVDVAAVSGPVRVRLERASEEVGPA